MHKCHRWVILLGRIFIWSRTWGYAFICDAKYIKETCVQISKRLNNKDTVILRSTVKIGTTRNIAFPILNKSKKEFILAYCPERAVEGAALKELKKLPQVIGILNKDSNKKTIFQISPCGLARKQNILFLTIIIIIKIFNLIQVLLN